MGYDDFEGGVTLFPYYDLGGGGLWKISNENYIKHRGGGATIHAQTGAPQLSGDDITDKMDLLVSKYKKDSRLFDALQELKDDLLDDTAWPDH